MKHTPLMKLLAVGAVSALAFGTAFGQTTKESSTTTTSDATGVRLVEHLDAPRASTARARSRPTPRGRNMWRCAPTTSTSPVKYYYTKNTTIVDPTGASVTVVLLRPDMPVRYTYVKEGDRMVDFEDHPGEAGRGIHKGNDHDHDDDREVIRPSDLIQ